MATQIKDLVFEHGPAGKKLISFRLIRFDNNVSLAAAQRMVDHAELRGLPEPIEYGPKEWYGIGSGCPVRMKVVGEGQEAKLHVMFNSPYTTDPDLTERSALLALPVILKEKGVIEYAEECLLTQQIEANVPETGTAGITHSAV